MEYVIKKPPYYFVPILHYNMECAKAVRLACLAIQPDCVAVELPEPLQEECRLAAARLPDLSCIITQDERQEEKILLAEPCDPAFEGLRYASEAKVAGFCVDLNVCAYPLHTETLPDPYAIERIGLLKYLHALNRFPRTKTDLDNAREQYMAKRLKELSFSYDRILVVIGMMHVHEVAKLCNASSFPNEDHIKYKSKKISTLTEESALSVMAEYGWMTAQYEQWRLNPYEHSLDRQKLIYTLLKRAIPNYEQDIRTPFPNYGLSLIMRYLRKYAAIRDRLLPDLYQLITACKICIDHNYAYEVWKLAVDYPLRLNLDALEEIPLTIEQVWGVSKPIWFHMKKASRKSTFLQRRKKDKMPIRLTPLNAYGICSYPPEDNIVETFGKYLQNKALAANKEQGTHSIIFTTSLEDGIDVRETIRHFTENKLYVKTCGRPTGGIGSIVVIFDEDSVEKEKYPWKLTWLGENDQESDMAFFATNYQDDIIGPGIGRCEYGGFLLSYPPRRMYDVWSDPDYSSLHSKAEILIHAAIDYAVKPVIVYAAKKAPLERIKHYAKRQGKRLVYLPIQHFARSQIQKIRHFHVLDGYHRRQTAGEYIG